MNGAPRTQLSSLLFCERNTYMRLILVLTIITLTVAIIPESEAADRVKSVASHIPTAPEDMKDMVRPLTVIDQQDIELSGMRNIEELLLHRLPYNSFGVYRPYILGENRVAVLINGRRI